MHRYPISNNRSNQSQYFLKKFYIIGKTFYFYRSTALKNTHIKLKMYKFITGVSNFFISISSICFLSSKVLTKNCPHISRTLKKPLSTKVSSYFEYWPYQLYLHYEMLSFEFYCTYHS